MRGTLRVRSVLFVFRLLELSCQNARAWNFSEVGFNGDVLIWRFTIWWNKAYLAIPRWKIDASYTLLEVPWPETGPLFQFGPTVTGVIPFPDPDSQREGNCQDLQSVTGVDSDVRGRLWVLDAPTRNQCVAKIVIFDLRRYEEITRIKLIGVPSVDLKCLVIDPVVGPWGHQAYVSSPGDETIVVYNPGQKRWWKLKLSGDFYHTGNIFSTDLAISRRNSLLYLTGYQSDDLFSIDLEQIRIRGAPPHLNGNHSIETSVGVSWVGSKLGVSSGLICDHRGGLYYFLLTELASVRWDSREKLKAESHAISLQSETTRCVTDYALDMQKNVWALVNDAHPFRRSPTMDHRENVEFERRTIRVYKYNPFAQYRST